MIVKAKKQKKVSISEEDIASLLQRYTPTTVLALLQEVAHSSQGKIDWNALVEKTTTGISNAREYQMLWHHLAYREPLIEKTEDGAQPLDDDSDLEYELEAFPAVSTEASNEAAACVKVLIASGLPSDPSGSTVEAPLTINIPNGQASKVLGQPSCSMQGVNITVPVSVQRLPTPVAVTTDGIDGNGSIGGSVANRKRRKPWTEAEDSQLIAAVQKNGEGNWANLVKADILGHRTPAQLSQRWSIIRKKHANFKPGNNSIGPQLSEAQLAARHAVSLALDNVQVKTMRSGGANATNNFTGTNAAFNSAGRNAANSSVLPKAGAEISKGGSSFPQAQKQSQESLIPSKPSPMGSLGLAAKSRVIAKKTLPKSTATSDAMVRATAVAAGARIASPSDAATLLKAFQANSAVHIMPTGGASVKSTMPSGLPTHSEASTNVHYIRTGLVTSSIPTYSTASPNVPSTSSVKAAPPAHFTPTTNSKSSDVSSSKLNNASAQLTPTTNGKSLDVSSKLNNGPVQFTPSTNSKSLDVSSKLNNGLVQFTPTTDGKSLAVSSKLNNGPAQLTPTTTSKSLNVSSKLNNGPAQLTPTTNGKSLDVASKLNNGPAHLAPTNGTSLDVSSKLNNGSSSSLARQPLSKGEGKATEVSTVPVLGSATKEQEGKTTEESKVPVSGSATKEEEGKTKEERKAPVSGSVKKEQVGNPAEKSTVPKSGSSTKEQEGKPTKEHILGKRACTSGDLQGVLVREYKVVSLNPDAELKGKSHAENPASSMDAKVAKNGNGVVADVQPKGRQNGNGNIKCLPRGGAENCDAIKKNGVDQNTRKMQEDIPSTIADGRSEETKILSKEVGNGTGKEKVGNGD
ncbi:hypothetical protein UlMin_036180 [Ulmus minor]